MYFSINACGYPPPALDPHTRPEQQIDQLERELVQLTHQRDLMTRGITGAAGLPKTGPLPTEDYPGGGDGNEYDAEGGGSKSSGPESVGARKAEAYALEMQVRP